MITDSGVQTETVSLLCFSWMESKNKTFLFTFDQEFFVQAMWAAPLCQAFLHLLYDKEILEEQMILQWYSRKSAGGEDSGFELQRKQLRQQVRHS